MCISLEFMNKKFGIVLSATKTLQTHLASHRSKIVDDFFPGLGLELEIGFY